MPAPGRGPGHWAGAASAVLDDDGSVWLADRLRRPLDDGRGVGVVVARSVDGVRFESVAEVGREWFDAASLERPALVRRPEGGWRLYLSGATPGSKHWWVEALDADIPTALPDGRRTVVHPGAPGSPSRTRSCSSTTTTAVDAAGLSPARPPRPRGPDDDPSAPQ